MKQISSLYEEAHQISILREKQNILKEISILLNQNKIQEAKLVLNEYLNHDKNYK